ncbi:MAG: hypothetical protein ACKO3T_00935, partial [Planctomycetaceae bacterium]
MSSHSNNQPRTGGQDDVVIPADSVSCSSREKLNEVMYQRTPSPKTKSSQIHEKGRGKKAVVGGWWGRVSTKGTKSTKEDGGKDGGFRWEISGGAASFARSVKTWIIPGKKSLLRSVDAQQQGA